jgi:hypothetical protein
VEGVDHLLVGSFFRGPNQTTLHILHILHTLH